MITPNIRVEARLHYWDAPPASRLRATHLGGRVLLDSATHAKDMRTLALLLAFVVGSATAQSPLLVRVEVVSPDSNLQYQIQVTAKAEIAQLKDAKLVDDSTAVIVVRFIAAPIAIGKESELPTGVALATLITRPHPSGGSEIRHYSNRAVPLAKYGDLVKQMVRLAPN